MILFNLRWRLIGYWYRYTRWFRRWRTVPQNIHVTIVRCGWCATPLHTKTLLTYEGRKPKIVERRRRIKHTCTIRAL